MRTLFRTTLITASAVTLCASTSAQSSLEARALPGITKNAGILHVATGTWTRNVASTANLGPDTVYINDSLTGYFGLLGSDTATGDVSYIDEGRLPGTDSAVALADRDDYCINGINFAYCTDQQGPIGITFNLYESYTPCDLIITDPAGSAPFTLSGGVVANGIPGGSGGGLGCWVVTLDLEGAGEFNMLAEGGDQFPGHDGLIESDSFGIEWMFNGVAGSNTGPILAGDPDWTLTVSGALLHGGTGTYYDNTTGSCGNTGFDTQDAVTVDGVNSTVPPGCYFFGGYLNTNGCGAAQNNPFASFNLTLFADSGACAPVLETFCDPAGVNSSGNAASISASPTGLGAGFRLDATGGPQLPNSGFGFFVVADSITAGLPVNQGVLCLGQPQGRYNPGAGGARNSLGQFDANGNFENLVGTSTTGFGFDIPTQLPSPPGGNISAGSTWHFQLWYRDLNPMATTNFSNGITLDF